MHHSLNGDMAAAQTAYSRRLGDYLRRSTYLANFRSPDVIDMAFGDPHHIADQAFIDHLKSKLQPLHADWFAYTRKYRPAQRHLASRLADDLGIGFDSNDILLTNGAFAGIMVCLRSLCARNSEVIYLSPSWFYYEPMILSAGATPREVNLKAGDWQLDIEAISKSINENTSAVIINSPNNPTGAIYSGEDLRQLADVLTLASRRYGHPIYLISDEAYRKIVFDDATCPSPVSYYPYSLLVYTYTKTLLTPGERVGFIALPEMMPNRTTLTEALETGQINTGWAFPNNALMYAIPNLDEHAISTGQLQQRRDFMVSGLVDAGYKALPAQGTFYLLVESPTDDDWAFVTDLEKQNLYVLPGSTMGASGYFRISLTVTDDMVRESLPRFRICHPERLRI